jgi:hypothetical protein
MTVQDQSSSSERTQAAATADIGVMGLAVMGANLARNLARHGSAVALFNRTHTRTQALVSAHGDEGSFVPATSVEEFVASLRRPRRVIIMVQAGKGTDAVIDSLVREGMNREMLERLRARVASGDVGAFFGGGGGPTAGPWQRGMFVERPGEGPPPRTRGAGQVAAQPAPTPAAEGRRGESGEGAEEPIDPEFAQDFIRLIRPAGQGGGGGGGFGAGRGAPVVATGDYLVTLEVGGQRLRQVLRVERVGPTEGIAAAIEDDDK